ncbi:unnamed protein product [Ectocarpus sp. CCAP 1310/34]|nr:unnamed protein product [Ectocarpus sp. CCAP 1310/34]
MLNDYGVKMASTVDLRVLAVSKDAVASALLYEAIHKNKDPTTSVPSSPFDPAIGLKVRLYNASHSACVAVGHVVSDATAEAALRHWQSSAKLQGGDPVEGSPILAAPGAGAAGAARAARAALPQFRACTECGHHKGAYPAKHPGNRRGHKAKGSAPQPDVEPAKKCLVDQSLRRPESDKVWNPKQRKRTFLPCPCDVCKGSYAHVEDGDS